MCKVRSRVKGWVEERFGERFVDRLGEASNDSWVTGLWRSWVTVWHEVG